MYYCILTLIGIEYLNALLKENIENNIIINTADNNFWNRRKKNIFNRL